MKKVNEIPKMEKQPGPTAVQKGKGVTEQKTPAAEQHLRMVPMIAGPALANEEEEKKSKHSIRIGQRVK